MAVLGIVQKRRRKTLRKAAAAGLKGKGTGGSVRHRQLQAWADRQTQGGSANRATGRVIRAINTAVHSLVWGRRSAPGWWHATLLLFGYSTRQC